MKLPPSNPIELHPLPLARVAKMLSRECRRWARLGLPTPSAARLLDPFKRTRLDYLVMSEVPEPTFCPLGYLLLQLKDSRIRRSCARAERSNCFVESADQLLHLRTRDSSL